MMRNFRKGLAIFLILCLLVNGAAAHEQTVSQKLQKAFEACASMGEVTAPCTADWHPISNTSEDILILDSYVLMPSAKVIYDWQHHVYDCYKLALLYYADYDVWFDKIDNVYFAWRGEIYIPTVSPSTRKGLYTLMDDLTCTEYQTEILRARSAMKNFQREMTQKMLYNVLPQQVDPDKTISYLISAW